MSLDFNTLDASGVTPETIKAEMTRRLEERGLEVDTRAGSYTDLLLSESAYQLYKAWQQFPVLLAAAVPGEDSGPYLDAFGEQFGLKRTPASTARVELTFTGEEGAVVPAGTVALTDQRGGGYPGLRDRHGGRPGPWGGL